MTDAPEWMTRYKELRAYLDEVTSNGSRRLANVTGLMDERTARHVEAQIGLAFHQGWNRRADLPATPAQIAASPEVRALVDVIQRVIADPHWRTTDNTLWPDMCKAVAAFKAMEAGE